MKISIISVLSTEQFDQYSLFNKITLFDK